MDIDQLFAQTLCGDYDDEAPWEAVHHLQKIGSRAVFDKAASWCRCDEALKRARGADVIAQLGKTEDQPTNGFAEESFLVLAMMALNEQASQPLSSAIHALGHLGDPRAVPIAANFGNHPDSRVRYAVAYACGCMPDERVSMDTLLELMRDEDSDVRDWATFGLGSLSSLDSPAIREQLVSALNDPNDDVRQEAFAGLARRRDLRVLPYLMAQLQQPQVDEVTIEAAGHMLGKNDPPHEWGPNDYLAALRERFGGEAA